MPALGDIVKGAADSIIGGATKIFDDLHTSPEEKADIAAKMATVVNERMAIITSEIQARFKMVTDVIQADNASGDTYTKRARPTLVYFGMLMIFINYLVVPILQTMTSVEVQPFPLPTEFWVAWGGTVAVWSVGRSAEKAAVSNRLTRGITGSAKNFDIEL